MVKFCSIFSSFISLLLLCACGGSSSNTSFSYTAHGSNKVPLLPTANYTPKAIVAEKTLLTKDKIKIEKQVKKDLKRGRFDRVGPILNKLAARNAINSYRKSLGLKPLKLNRHLENAAYLHSIEMARLDNVFHVGPLGTDPWDRVVARGYKPEMATENIGAGQSDFKSLLSLWKVSKDHNANLLIPDATDMGIALIHDKHTKHKTFWTLVIAKRSL